MLTDNNNNNHLDDRWTVCPSYHEIAARTRTGMRFKSLLEFRVSASLFVVVAVRFPFLVPRLLAVFMLTFVMGLFWIFFRTFQNFDLFFLSFGTHWPAVSIPRRTIAQQGISEIWTPKKCTHKVILFPGHFLREKTTAANVYVDGF